MTKYKLSPEEYQNILQKITLDDIRLISSNIKFIEENYENSLTIEIEDKLGFTDLENGVIFKKKYTFKAKGVSNENPVISINCEYQAKYDKKSAVIVNKDFVEIFGDTSMDLLLWPFFREYIHSSISRMNLPPLLLPMKRLLTSGDK